MKTVVELSGCQYREQDVAEVLWNVFIYKYKYLPLTTCYVHYIMVSAKYSHTEQVLLKNIWGLTQFYNIQYVENFKSVIPPW